jgi:hypothetical protein
MPARPAKKSEGGLGKLLVIGAIAAVLVLGLTVGGAYMLFSGGDTGTVRVLVMGVPDDVNARVFVDGVQRGDAPLMLEHVPEGEHVIEVRAAGYQNASRSVPVTADGMVMLEIRLEADTALAAAAPPPVVAAPAPPPAPAPAVVAMADPTPAPDPSTLVAPVPPPVPQPPPPAPVAREPEPAPQARAERTERTAREAPRERPRRTEEEDEAPRGAAAGAYGFLRIQTIPWARVFVDGRDTGRNTPVPQLRVPAGRHTIGLRTNDGTMHTVVVTVAAGETQRIARQL